jgi:hypothetical protein
MNTLLTEESFSDTPNKPSFLNHSVKSEEDWRSYLGICDEKTISQDHAHRLALTKLFHQYSLEGRLLYHLTITYKEYRETQYSKRICDQFFINFYLKSFLPALLGTRNFNKPSERLIQPICYAFIDEHESKPRIRRSKVEFPTRLHHHALIAVNSTTSNRISPMIGSNQIPLRQKYASKVMTTHLRACEPMTLLYASKNLRRYPDFLAFPDRLMP